MTVLEGGLWRQVVDGDQIDHAAWLRAHATRELVGDCRCGGYLAPAECYELGHVMWYEARCVTCGQVAVAPGGRTLRRSGRRSEQPTGWWEKRTEAMKHDHSRA